MTAARRRIEIAPPDIERWRRMMADLQHVGLVSISSRRHENDELPPPDVPARPDTQPDRLCARSELRQALSRAIKTLPGRYRKVVILYYTNGLTMKEIGGMLGINESRVSQIHKSALAKMASALESAGLQASHFLTS